MKKEKYYGIYINNKIPKIKDNKNINKYNGSITPKFEGKAYILKENCEKKEKLENNTKFKKEGKHTIQFINNNKQIYYIDIEIKKHIFYVLFFILMLILSAAIMVITFNQDCIKEYKVSEFGSFDVELEGFKYVFDINYENTDFKNISLTDKVTEKNIIYPGSYGYFYIEISTKNGNQDMIYNMQIQDEISKPQNLKFEVNGKVYNSMKELANSINGIIDKNDTKILKIKWFWEYDTEENDIVDTNDGENLDTYKVLMRMTGTVEN